MQTRGPSPEATAKTVLAVLPPKGGSEFEMHGLGYR